ncbi:hypothetical protein ACQP1O_16800 [Nocardia sp. CA-151230]|uniref:hypothetical protein n=1 Tax=Nocardia sp. CA-151230 TaxID=3239982 RepID=UPI003D94EADB
MKVLNPLDICASPDELLRVVDNPRHRAMLKNYRRHAMLEVAGRFGEVLDPGMLVDHPVYRIFESGKQLLLNGRGEVAAYYRDFELSGATVFGPLEERMAVADWGLALESHFGCHMRGYQLAALGVEVGNLEGFYQLNRWVSSFWPFDENCLLIGENIYENFASREVHMLNEADFVTQERASALLDPILDGPEED